MVIAAIYVTLALASFLLWLGFSKDDEWIVIFSGMIFVFSGLNILINGFQDLAKVYSQALGVIVLFIGAYFMIRSVIERIQEDTI